METYVAEFEVNNDLGITTTARGGAQYNNQYNNQYSNQNGNPNNGNQYNRYKNDSWMTQLNAVTVLLLAVILVVCILLAVGVPSSITNARQVAQLPQAPVNGTTIITCACRDGDSGMPGEQGPQGVPGESVTGPSGPTGPSGVAICIADPTCQSGYIFFSFYFLFLFFFLLFFF